MLSKSQLLFISQVVEKREQNIDAALKAMNNLGDPDELKEELANEMIRIDDVKPVLCEMFNEQSEFDGDILGNCYVQLSEITNNCIKQDACNMLLIEIGRLIGKLEAGLFTEEDWSHYDSLMILLNLQ